MLEDSPKVEAIMDALMLKCLVLLFFIGSSAADDLKIKSKSNIFCPELC